MNTETILGRSLLNTAIGRMMKAHSFIRTADEKNELIPQLTAIINMAEMMIRELNQDEEPTKCEGTE